VWQDGNTEVLAREEEDDGRVNLSPEKRTALAKKAADARWAKKRSKE
jgi:hypothetical protein